MAATKVNLNGINEIDLNLSGTTSAVTSAGVTTVTNSPAVATSTTVGVVKPDNKTVQVAPDGTITASGPAPAFVQGAQGTSSSATMLVSLSGISLANSLILQVRCSNSSAPTFNGIGNAYVSVHSQYNSFWGVGTYTYLCFGALATTESITFTGLGAGTSTCVLAEYTTVAGFEAAADNGVSANANLTSTLSITSTKGYERAIFIFSCNAFSGQTPNQTQRVPAVGSSAIMLMDAAVANAGTTVAGTVTSSAMNQSSITGFLLTSVGVVQSVGLSMPSDFTVTGSPVNGVGIFQVTGGVTKAGVQQNTYVSATDTGTANNYIVTITPAPTIGVYSEVIFKASNSNTGASTLKVNGTTYPLTKNGATALSSGDIVAGQVITAKCDGTNFQVTIGSSAAAGVSSLNSLAGPLTLVAGSNITITPSGSNITIAATSGGGTPTTIPNMIYWFSADRLNYNNATTVSSLYDTSTATTASPARAAITGPTYGTGVINGLPAFTFPGNSNGDMTIYPAANLKQSTVFVVAAPSNVSGSCVFGGSSGAFQVNVSPSNVSLTKSFVVVIASSTTALSVGTWYQVNATYNDSTGAYAFRVARAAAGSGTSVNTITALSDSFGWVRQGGAGSDGYNGKIAEVIVYNRVLSGAEITTIETYLNGKYGI